MRILEPSWTSQFPELIAAMSTIDNLWPDLANMSTKGGNTAQQNRYKFLELLKVNKPVFNLKQIHSDIVVAADPTQSRNDGDAIISNDSQYLLAIFVADCVPVVLFDPITKAQAIVHSGWRGCKSNIVNKTIKRLELEFGTKPQNLLCWIGPAAQIDTYEVGEEFKGYFPERFQTVIDGRRYLNTPEIVVEQLISSGVKKSNIEVSDMNTMTDESLFSFRSGENPDYRMMVLVGLR